jgi:hypothetical protein
MYSPSFPWFMFIFHLFVHNLCGLPIGLSKFIFRHGSNGCDSCERWNHPKINPEAAQEAISGFIFHNVGCSKLSHWSELILNHVLE